MEKFYCTQCGAENEADYDFCVNCGTRLKKPSANATNPGSFEAAPTYINYTPYQPIYDCAEIGGVPTEAMAILIDSNNSDYIGKFSKMERNGKKASWNWAVALLGFLAGLPFVWFFYRKIYKAGAIILAICLALTIAGSVCGAVVIDAIYEPASEFLSEAIALSEEGRLYEDVFGNSLIKYIENIAEASGTKILICLGISSLCGMINLALCVWASIAANNIYKNDLIKRFNNAYKKNSEGVTESYLKRIGGTSMKAAVLSVVGFVVLSAVAEALVTSGKSAELENLLLEFSEIEFVEG